MAADMAAGVQPALDTPYQPTIAERYLDEGARLMMRQLGSPLAPVQRVRAYRAIESRLERDRRLTLNEQNAVAVHLPADALTAVLDRPDWSLRESQRTFAWLTERAARVRVTGGDLYYLHLDAVFYVSLLYADQCLRRNHVTEARAVVAYVRRRYGRLRRLRRCSGLARFCAIARLAHLRIEAAAADPSLRAHGLRVLGTSRRKR
jgi:hypothetical protein